MAYIGNTVQNQGFSPAVDYFNGNGVTVTFTLSRPVASVAQMIVAVDNVIQNPSSAFSVVGNSITFTSAPLSGTNNIWVEYTSLITTYQGISQDPTVIGDIRATGGYLAEGDFGNSFIDGNLIDYVTGRGRFTVGELDNITFYHGGTSARSEMMDLYYAGGAKIYGTTALTIPVGTTAQRPTGAFGMIRANSTTGLPEWYDSSAAIWKPFNVGITYTASYLLAAGGGGGGGYNSGAGGGAGGLITGTATFSTGTTYAVVVGAGGSGQTSTSVGTTTNGSNTTALGLTAIGGGYGGSNSYIYAGSNGGSGGGAPFDGASTVYGLGTSGQGNNGGSGGSGPTGYPGGGGGGAGAAGQSSPNNNQGGNGGIGLQSSITGSAVYYCGGGGGSTQGGGFSSTGGSGGGGGGGSGTGSGVRNGTSGAANTGGGGGAGGYDGITGLGGSGGSGVVIFSVPTANYSGITTGSPTITTSGSNTIITFTSSGTYVA